MYFINIHSYNISRLQQNFCATTGEFVIAEFDCKGLKPFSVETQTFNYQSNLCDLIGPDFSEFNNLSLRLKYPLTGFTARVYVSEKSCKNWS